MEKPELFKNGKRMDGRTLEETREVRIMSGVLKEAVGSAFVQWGGNKVIAGVYGPRECIPRHMANPYKAIIKCKYMMSPFASTEGHGRSGPNRRSIEISKVIREVFENVVLVNRFPKTQIDLNIDILQAEGGTRVAAITAAAVALADAGIPMRDMVSAISTGKIDGQLVVDLGKNEDNYGESDVPIAMRHRTKEILLLQMDGKLTKEELKKNLEMAEKACEMINKKQTDAIKAGYEKKEVEFKL
ncbi:exosome complex exonuclease Rrp41 [Candidatus Micrarchaeota archaeon]|nr:exosome complex exonuclease Rrp41 [Candidatus Micrarchaeota archaeon]